MGTPSLLRILKKLARDKHKDWSSQATTERITGTCLHCPSRTVLMAQVCLLIITTMPVSGGLESNVQSNETKMPGSTNNNAPFAGGHEGSTYHNEIAGLWKDLSVLSETASSLIAGDDAISLMQTPKSNDTGQATDLMINGSSTNAQANQAEDDDRSLIISVITANILIFVIGFCGNSLVILVILRFTKIETVTDIYILNLAFADLMFLFGLIFLIITMFIDHWVFGNLMCKLYMASTSLNQFASSLLLVVMSFDRFLAVCHPIYAQRFRRLRRAKIICLCIWIVCLILMTPIFAFAKTNKDLTCAIFWPEYKSFNCEIAFTMYSFAIGFAFPLLLIAAFYICVIRKLRIAASGPINLGSRRSRSRETTNKRIEHLVIGIIFTYTICWLPYWISQLCVSFTTTLERSPIEGFYPFVLVATCLSYTNSALNPILYAFLSDNFKRRCADVFRSILSIKWCPLTPANETQATLATALYEPSEINSCARPESRQTVIMNEAVRLVTNPSQLAEILTTDVGQVGSNNNSNSNNAAERARRSGSATFTGTLIAGTNNSMNHDKINRKDSTNSNFYINLNDSHALGGGGGSDLNVNGNNCSANNKTVPSPTIPNGADGGAMQTVRKKSVAFNVGTVVIQRTLEDEPPPSASSGHKNLETADNNRQQCQEAV